MPAPNFLATEIYLAVFDAGGGYCWKYFRDGVQQCCASTASGSRLEFAESCRDGETRCADGGQQATNQTHDKSKDNALYEQFGGDLEGEGQVGKSLKIHGAGG